MVAHAICSPPPRAHIMVLFFYLHHIVMHKYRSASCTSCMVQDFGDLLACKNLEIAYVNSFNQTTQLESAAMPYGRS